MVFVKCVAPIGVDSPVVFGVKEPNIGSIQFPTVTKHGTVKKVNAKSYKILEADGTLHTIKKELVSKDYGIY